MFRSVRERTNWAPEEVKCDSGQKKLSADSGSRGPSSDHSVKRGTRKPLRCVKKEPKADRLLQSFEVALKTGSPEVLAWAPGGTGRLCEHYCKQSGSKFKQEVSPLGKFTAVGLFKDTATCLPLAYYQVIVLDIWQLDCFYAMQPQPSFLFLLLCSCDFVFIS